tara:strand:- start:27706 stop:28260 length:555 start_codon:yes stop_codon:yes gene_type:complete
MEIKNISILEYFELQDTSDYDFFIDLVKPENLFCKRVFDVSKMTYNEFHTIISIFNNPNLENIKDLFVHLYRIKGDLSKSAEKMFFDESIFTFFKAKKFISEMIKEKLRIEDKALYSEPDTRLIEIGASKRLKPFSVMLTKVSLGKQFGIDPYEIGNWQYSKVFNILATNNALNQVQKDYNAKN